MIRPTVIKPQGFCFNFFQQPNEEWREATEDEIKEMDDIKKKNLE
jgi:hypothetical protein